MTTRTYVAEQCKTLDLALDVARISEKLNLRRDEQAEIAHGLRPRALTERRHRRQGGHLRLVGGTAVTALPVAEPGPLRAPRDTA